MAYGIWDVSGKVLIPGARKSASFGPVRIVEKDRQTASKYIGDMLNEKFRKELRGDNRFSAHYALLNLKWVDVVGKTTPTAGQENAAAE